MVRGCTSSTGLRYSNLRGHAAAVSLRDGSSTDPDSSLSFGMTLKDAVAGAARNARKSHAPRHFEHRTSSRIGDEPQPCRILDCVKSLKPSVPSRVRIRAAGGSWLRDHRGRGRSTARNEACGRLQVRCPSPISRVRRGVTRSLSRSLVGYRASCMSVWRSPGYPDSSHSFGMTIRDERPRGTNVHV